MSKSLKQKLGDSFEMKECKYCLSVENLTIDHKIPKINGGTDKLSNLQCLCKKCNGIKSGMSHNQVVNIWKWFIEINKLRLAKGKKEYLTDKE